MVLVILLTMISGCQVIPESEQLVNLSNTPDMNPTEIPTSTPLATPVIYQSPFSAWIDPAFPPAVRDQLATISTLQVTSNMDDSQVRFTANAGQLTGSWIYLAVVPFHSFQDEISSTEILSIWKDTETDPSSKSKIYLTEDTKNALSLLWGEPSENRVAVSISSDIPTSIWNEVNSFVLIPFEDLVIDWKVLKVDGVDPLDPNFDKSLYELTIPIKTEAFEIPFSALQITASISNYDQDKLSSVALTGVTALVRDTAALMEEYGVTYPAEEIKGILKNASITHISNEVPFAEDCPAPDPSQESLYFCSKDSYLELLKYVGTDIVELSGDHFGDWGSEAMLHSLELYDEQGWLTYGGGENLQAGLEPVFIEHNGNSFAFIGCNGKAHDRYATATDTNPGASRCNFDWMISEIARLDSEGHIVITTMQHEEVNSFYSIAIQQYDFGRLADAGSTIVSGSQAHHPQAFEYTGDTFIHYGLGNLFFDQWYLAKYNADEHANEDKAFIDLHYFYNGSHVNTRLITIQFIDNAQSRLMSPDENESLLLELFQYSTWRDQPLLTPTW